MHSDSSNVCLRQGLSYHRMATVRVPSHRQLLVDTFQSFGHFQRTCKELGLSTKGTARGLTLLFYGPSGTGEDHMTCG